MEREREREGETVKAMQRVRKRRGVKEDRKKYWGTREGKLERWGIMGGEIQLGKGL